MKLAPYLFLAAFPACAGLVQSGFAPLAGLGKAPVPFRVSVDALASGRGEPERFVPLEGTDTVTFVVRSGRMDGDAWRISATVGNNGAAPRCLRPRWPTPCCRRSEDSQS